MKLRLIILTLLSSLATPTMSDDLPCPKTWFELELPQNIKQCRVFGVKKPSTLSFFALETPESLVRFFSSNTKATQSGPLNGYTQVQLTGPDFNIFIYADGAGTQVNIKAEQ